MRVSALVFLGTLCATTPAFASDVPDASAQGTDVAVVGDGEATKAILPVRLPVLVMAPVAPVALVAPVAPLADASGAKDAGLAATDAKVNLATVAATTTTPLLKQDAPAPVIAPPENVSDAFKTGGLMIEAAKNGNWVLFSGLLIMIIVFILDKVIKLKSIVPKTAVPWVASAFGIVGSVAVQLTYNIPWGQALVQGLLSGMVAVGFWEMFFKKILADKPTPTTSTDMVK